MKDWIDQRLREAIAMAHEPVDPGLQGIGTSLQWPGAYTAARHIAEDSRAVRHIATWMPISLEAKADMGLPLTDAERAILSQREAALDAYRRSWRAKWHRVLWAYGSAKHRLRHALDALRGVECERDDY